MTDEEPEEGKQSPIERAEAAAARLEEANKKAEALAERNEEAASRAILGGKSDAGQAPEKPKEETPEEYVDRIMTGEQREQGKKA